MGKRAVLRKKGASGAETLQEWVAVWVGEILPHVVKDSTCAMYEDTMKRHILPSLGEKRLEEISSGTVQEWLACLQRTQVPGTMQGRMAEGTLRNTLSVLGNQIEAFQIPGMFFPGGDQIDARCPGRRCCWHRGLPRRRSTASSAP